VDFGGDEGYKSRDRNHRGSPGRALGAGGEGGAGSERDPGGQRQGNDKGETGDDATGWTDAWPASRGRIGPAAATVITVEPMSIPADRAASPAAMGVVATEAISHGARPMVMMPSRSDPAATTWETAQDSAGSTVIPAARAASKRPRRRETAQRGGLDGHLGSEHQNGQQDVDPLVVSSPGQRRPETQAEDRGGEQASSSG
jgi:hypothetical protein